MSEVDTTLSDSLKSAAVILMEVRKNQVLPEPKELDDLVKLIWLSAASSEIMERQLAEYETIKTAAFRDVEIKGSLQ